MDITRPSPAHPHAATRPSARAGTLGADVRGPRSRLARAAATVLVLPALAFLAIIAVYAYVQFSPRLLPGVTIGGVPMQGLTLEQATSEIHRIWNLEYRVAVVDTSDLARAWIATPSEFGLAVDAAATARTAFEVGRQGSAVAALQALLAGASSGIPVRPIVAFDPAIAEQGLSDWSTGVFVAPTEGDLDLDGATIIAMPGQAGKALDIEATIALLQADPASALLDYAVVPLVMRPVDPRIGDVSASVDEAQALLTAGLTLQAYDPVTDEHVAWSPSPAVIAAWLEIRRTESSFDISFAPDRFAATLPAWTESLGADRSLDRDQASEAARAGLSGETADPVIIRYRSTPYVVGSGETLAGIGYRLGMPSWLILDANPGLRTVTPGQTITLPPRDVTLPLPVVYGKRIVISIAEQHLWARQDGAVVRDEVISTGMRNSGTLPGVFQVQSHIPNAYGSNWDLWMPHFLGIYEALPDFWNGIHGLPMLSSGVRLWADVLGRPASYGCIILDLEAAEWLYGWAEDGVVVEIRR
jgi:hypothetical protein